MSDPGDAAESREVLARALCEQSTKILGVFTLAVIFLILQVPYLVVVEPDSSLYVVATLNVFGSAVFALTSGGALWFCRQRRP